MASPPQGLVQVLRLQPFTADAEILGRHARLPTERILGSPQEFSAQRARLLC